MPPWPWIERKFNFDYPPEKFPDALERLRGTPARLEERVRHAAPETLTWKHDGGWSILENIGHLIDLGALPARRIEQILAGEHTLVGADMTNKLTHDADHNSSTAATLLARFRVERAALISRLESLNPEDWGRSGLHPRLNAPMRIVDIAVFDSEHDDYHLARIGQILRSAHDR
jgi:hypothetical protein